MGLGEAGSQAKVKRQSLGGCPSPNPEPQAQLGGKSLSKPWGKTGARVESLEPNFPSFAPRGPSLGARPGQELY